jgi:hypothetical protein
MEGQKRLDTARTILGREPTPAERVQIAGLTAAAGPRTAAQEIAEMEQALGRPLTPQEKARKLGVDPGDAQLHLWRAAAGIGGQHRVRSQRFGIARGKIQQQVQPGRETQRLQIHFAEQGLVLRRQLRGARSAAGGKR